MRNSQVFALVVLVALVVLFTGAADVHAAALGHANVDDAELPAKLHRRATTTTTTTTKTTKTSTTKTSSTSTKTSSTSTKTSTTKSSTTTTTKTTKTTTTGSSTTTAGTIPTGTYCPTSSGQTAPIPSSAIVVAADGSGQFTTIASAIASIPASNAAEKVVYVKAGVYNENFDVPQNFVTLVGDGQCKTVIIDDLNHASTGSSAEASTVRSKANDFRAFHITFINNAPWPISSDGQAPAFMSNGSRIFLFDCGFISGEDTFLTLAGYAYIKNSYIVGDTDFIWGRGGAVFDNVRIHVDGKKSSSIITAHGNEDSTFPTGFWIKDSVITAESNVADSSVVLGRPWKTYAQVVYSNTSMPAVINPVGWNLGLGDFSATCKLGEVTGSNYGTGAATSSRVSWETYWSAVPNLTTWLGGGSTSWLSLPIY